MGGIAISAPAYAEWNASADEANRQRMMASMRDSAAANDRRNADSAFQSGLSRNNSSPSATSSSNSSSSSFSRATPNAPAVDRGPQSVVATRRFIVMVRETEPQVVARITREAEAGKAQSQYNLGQIYYAGYGVTRSDVQARRWFSAAAAQGHAPAAAQAGYFAMYGRGGPVDMGLARTALAASAKAGDSYGEALFGMLQISDATAAGRVDTPLPEAVALLVSAADAGEVSAQSALGTLIFYFGGFGVAQDHPRALRYMQLAAAQNDPIALGELGEHYLGGRMGLPQDRAKGWEFVRRGADRGNGRAAFLLAICLIQGSNGLGKNEAEGVKYARISAEIGDADGQSLLGALYYEGGGVPKDLKEAARWLRKAAAQGNADAIKTLAEPDIAAAARTLQPG